MATEPEETTTNLSSKLFCEENKIDVPYFFCSWHAMEKQPEEGRGRGSGTLRKMTVTLNGRLAFKGTGTIRAMGQL